MLKQKLLDTGLFIDNVYLDDYIALITNPFYFSNYTEYHHVIPVYCYKKQYGISDRYLATKKADADINNKLVKLSFADHIKAHWLLSKCSLVKENEFAVYQMTSKIIGMTDIRKTNNEILKNGLTEEEFQYINLIKEDLVANSNYYWSAWEELWLKENYKKYSRKYCAEFLDKTEAGIHKKCQTLKLMKASTKWTDEDDAWLSENYKSLGIVNCSVYLNRSYNSIIARLAKLNLDIDEKLVRSRMKYSTKCRHRWTEEEEAWLLNNYELLGLVKCAEFLKVSQSAIEHKINRLHKK